MDEAMEDVKEAAIDALNSRSTHYMDAVDRLRDLKDCINGAGSFDELGAYISQITDGGL